VAAAVGERLRARGASVRQLSGASAAESLDLCRGAVADGVDAVVALGGDGMVHLALQAVVETATPLGIVPAGTGNDLAASLGLPVDNPLAAADVLLTASPRGIDAVRAAGKWFGCVLGAGFDSKVNERANRMRWPRGGSRYNLAIAAELRVFKPLPFVVTVDDDRIETDAMLVAVGNARSYGAGMQVTPDARLDDGAVDVMILGPVSKLEFIKTFPKVFKGTHVTHPAVTIRRGRVVTVESPGITAYADGEPFGPLPLTCECVAGAVTVLAPPAGEDLTP
ncbi:MAG: diacylglycerol kinase family protein, partial [Mycobacteriales bacterium]